MKVAISISSFDRPEGFWATYNSLLISGAQSGHQFEFWLNFDGEIPESIPESVPGHGNVKRISYRPDSRGIGRVRWMHCHNVIKNSDADILIFVDDDITVSPTYIRTIVDLLSDVSVGMASGTSKQFNEKMLKFDPIDQVTQIPTIRDNFAIRTSDIAVLGGVDWRFNYYEDFEMMNRYKSQYGINAVTARGAEVFKEEWRMLGGIQSQGDRGNLKLESALEIARTYPGIASIVHDGKDEPHGWIIHFDETKLHDLEPWQVVHEFNKVD